MSEKNTTKWGFPKGRVAEVLKSILNLEITTQETNIITVVLFSHLLLEEHLNRIFYALLVVDLPKPPDEEKCKKMKDDIWERVERTTFGRKLDYLKPCLKEIFPGIIKKIESLNEVRNKIFHGKEMRKLKFQGQSIWSEDGIEEYFIKTQTSCMELTKFHELIDAPHAQAENMAKKLREMGQAPF